MTLAHAASAIAIHPAEFLFGEHGALHQRLQ
jgi:hypothetical protein